MSHGKDPHLGRMDREALRGLKRGIGLTAREGSFSKLHPLNKEMKSCVDERKNAPLSLYPNPKIMMSGSITLGTKS